MIRIFTDSAANLPTAYTKANHVTVIPFQYMVNGVPVEVGPDDEFDGEGFYKAMREGADVSTSLINIGNFMDAFEPALKAGDDVIYVGMSGGISGTANSARKAAEELLEEYTERKIATIDTYAASLGEGLFVIDAVDMLSEGRSFEEIVDRINDDRHRMCQYFTVDDLMYLKKGGRISGAGALIGNVLHIKPILTGNEIGQIVLNAKVRGSKNAFKLLSEKYDELAADRFGMVGIAHAGNQEGADLLEQLLRQKGFKGKCLNVWYEPMTGSHVGPGTVAFFYMGIHK